MKTISKQLKDKKSYRLGANNKKKGFTLLELLGVIILVAVIALITIPIVLNVIGKTKHGAFKDSVYGLMDSAEFYYAKNLSTDNLLSLVIGIQDQEPNMEDFNYKGKKVEKAYIEVTGEGQTRTYVWDEGLCGVKGLSEKEVSVYEGKEKDECNFSLIGGLAKPIITANKSGWMSDDVTITIKNYNEDVTYQYYVGKDLNTYDNKKWKDTETNPFTIIFSEEDMIDEDGEYYVFVRGIKDGEISEVSILKLQIDQSQQELIITSAVGGTVSKDKETYKVEEMVTLQFTADTGYELKSISAVDFEDNEIELTEGTNGVYTFKMAKGPVVVTYETEKILYSLTVTQATGGTFSLSQTTAYYGDSITVTATPDTNYALSTLKYNGNDITSTKTFTMPASDVTVTGSWYMTVVTKYRTKSWVNKTCYRNVCNNTWRCCGNMVGTGCPCCTGAASSNCGPQTNGSCCGEFQSCGQQSYDCGYWSGWSSWTTTACTPSSTCEKKVCLASSAAGACTAA